MEEKQQQQPKHDQLSDLKVMKSAAGYYVGREQYDRYMQGWMPYNRVSGYTQYPQRADKILEAANKFQKDISSYGSNDLKRFTDQLAGDDLSSKMKKNIIEDTLLNVRKEVPQIHINMDFSR